MPRSYISVSEGVTACNSLALCGCSPSAFAPSDNPDFTGIVCAPAFSATTCARVNASNTGIAGESYICLASMVGGGGSNICKGSTRIVQYSVTCGQIV